MAAAAALFNEQGYDRTSLEDIASRVGIWKGSVYHYISAKEDLLEAVIKPGAELVMSDLRAVVASALPAPDKLRRVAHLHGAALERTFAAAAVYLQEVAGNPRWPATAALDRDYLRLVEEIVRDGAEAAEMRADHSPKIIAHAFVGALNWVPRWYRPDGERSLTEIAEEIAEVFLLGVQLPSRRRR